MDEESISESGGLTGNWNGPRLASEAEVDEIDFDKIVDVDADDEGEVHDMFSRIFSNTNLRFFHQYFSVENKNKFLIGHKGHKRHSFSGLNL